MRTEQQTARITPAPLTLERTETELHYGVGVKYSATAEPRITCPICRAKGGECIRTPIRFSVATAIIGPIIPPSIPMIIYGATAQQPVTQLFLAGFLPGLLIGTALGGMWDAPDAGASGGDWGGGDFGGGDFGGGDFGG